MAETILPVPCVIFKKK